MRIFLPNTLIAERYHIVKIIASGGLGAVYEARDLGRDISVALKQSGVAQQPAAFARAARQLAALDHPALPRVEDYVALGGDLFLVAEFIPGPDLEQLLAARGEPFALDDVLAWADQLLDALAYLHGQQPALAHGDIKPQNLKLTARGRVILLDVAGSRVGQRFGPRTAGTQPATFVYAPSERATGGRADPRADLYALAATLYHLLAGVPPAGAGMRAEMLDARLPDPLAPIHEISPLVPAAVGQALHATLSLDPRQRPRSARDMLSALQRARGGEPPAPAYEPRPGAVGWLRWLHR
jgi:eukaryotic-like serine/threonine-protein kinase